MMVIKIERTVHDSLIWCLGWGEGKQEMKPEGRGREVKEEGRVLVEGGREKRGGGGEEKKSQPWRTQCKAQKKPVTPPDSFLVEYQRHALVQNKRLR